ncbi:unnamed protein product, partial [Mesorhabditis belari]|uniref:ISXO2-like transposase domain-containing protein n=1 Tax=Mesorhabditis belari TaxID=2138241 RepID=A0AAF3J857_9BILA
MPKDDGVEANPRKHNPTYDSIEITYTGQNGMAREEKPGHTNESLGWWSVDQTECLFFSFLRRDAATLLHLIQQYVSPGTKIVSDFWRAYGSISSLQANFQHVAVNYKLCFVEPNDPTAHTQDEYAVIPNL